MVYNFSLNTNTSTSFVIALNDKTFRVHIKYVANSDRYIIDIDKYVDNQYINIINSVPINIGVDLMFPWRNIGLGRLYCIPIDKRYYLEDPRSETIVKYYIFQWSDK